MSAHMHEYAIYTCNKCKKKKNFRERLNPLPPGNVNDTGTLTVLYTNL